MSRKDELETYAAQWAAKRKKIAEEITSIIETTEGEDVKLLAGLIVASVLMQARGIHWLTEKPLAMWESQTNVNDQRTSP